MLRSIAHRLPVMGVDGYIYLDTDDPAVDDKGRLYEDEKIVGQLKVASFKTPKGLWTVDGTVFFVQEPLIAERIDTPVDYSIIQGFYEGQNEPPGMKTTPTILPFGEGTAKATKALLIRMKQCFVL